MGLNKSTMKLDCRLRETYKRMIAPLAKLMDWPAIRAVGLMMPANASNTMQRMGASRLAQAQLESPRRLAPTADGGRWPCRPASHEECKWLLRIKS